MAIIAQDSWDNRSSPNGWGTAQIGGAYTEVGGWLTSVTTGLGVVGPITSTSRQTQFLTLTSTLQTLTTVDISADIGPADGTSMFVRVMARVVDVNHFYYAEVQCRPLIDGGSRIRIGKSIFNTTSQAVQRINLITGPSTFGYTGGTVMRVVFEVLPGTNPTQMRAKFWRPGIDPDPGWQVGGTTLVSDSEAVLQTGGGVGLEPARQGSGSPTWRFDNYSVDSTTAGSPNPLFGSMPVRSTMAGNFTNPVTLERIMRARSAMSASLDIGGPSVFARDRFDRIETDTNAWGEATIGGAWTMDVHGNGGGPVDPPPGGGIVGYGANTVGGDVPGTQILHVTNLNAAGTGSLRAAVEANGPRIVVFDVTGTIDLAATDINVQNGNLTIDGFQAPGPVAVKGGQIKVDGGSEYVFRYLRLRSGDAVSNADNVEPLTINGNNRVIRNVLIDHCSLIWGPDIGGLAIMGDVADVTVQNSIIGSGLWESEHAQSHAGDGHSTAFNLAYIAIGQSFVQRVTIWRNLILNSTSRNPRVVGAANVDIINNVIYNWEQDSILGCPQSLNVINNWYKKGPNTTQFRGFKLAPDADWTIDSRNTDSVYLDGNVADGWTWAVQFTHASFNAVQPVQATSIRGTLSVVPETAAQARAAIIANVGPRTPNLDVVDQDMLDRFINDTGQYYNGMNYAPPNPYWPY